MAKKSPKGHFVHHLVHRIWALAKRNPLAAIATMIGIFGGIPAAVAGAIYLNAAVEPAIPALHWWVRDHTDERLKPLLLAQQGHAADLDYLILKEQRRALSEAKDDLKRDPQSSSAPKEIQTLQRSIDVRQKRLDEATRK